MGCDIHLYREKKVGGKWLAADKWVQDKYEEEPRLVVDYDDQAYTGRNYNLFGMLSKGVREDFDFAFVARGIPFDACPEIAACAERWDADGHSHSYLTLAELKAFREFLNAHKIPVSGMMSADQLERLNAGMQANPPDYSELYPYCKWTNAKGHVDFEVQVPASYMVGSCLDTIITTLEAATKDAEDARIVFFFDN